MSITTFGRQLVHYEAHGRGEPLLFVHGWLGSWRYWWPSMQSLSTHFRTFALDLWGFGDSTKDPALYSVDAYVEMVDQFIDRLGILTPLSVVGHGLGAAVALRYANRRPDRVKRLVIVALPVEGRQLNERLRTMPGDAFLQRFIYRIADHPEVERESHKTDQNAMWRLAEEVGTTDFADDLERVASPSLLVYGEHDPVVATPNGDYASLRQATVNRQFVELPEAGHFPMLEDSARFNRLVLDFLMAEAVAEVAPKDMWQRRTR